MMALAMSPVLLVVGTGTIFESKVKALRILLRLLLRRHPPLLLPLKVV
jgi:hypothetical protein